MIDRTPTSVTLPAYAWKTVREACAAHAKRLRYRSARRQAPEGYTDVDALRAETLEDAAATLAAMNDPERR